MLESRIKKARTIGNGVSRRVVPNPPGKLLEERRVEDNSPYPPSFPATPLFDYSNFSADETSSHGYSCERHLQNERPLTARNTQAHSIGMPRHSRSTGKNYKMRNCQEHKE